MVGSPAVIPLLSRKSGLLILQGLGLSSTVWWSSRDLPGCLAGVSSGRSTLQTSCPGLAWSATLAVSRQGCCVHGMVHLLSTQAGCLGGMCPLCCVLVPGDQGWRCRQGCGSAQRRPVASSTHAIPISSVALLGARSWGWKGTLHTGWLGQGAACLTRAGLQG